MNTGGHNQERRGTPNTAADGAAAPAPVSDRSVALAERLGALRRAAWAALVAERTGWVVGIALVALVTGGVLDYALRAPEWLRGLGLIGAIVGLVVLVWRVIVPAARFRPTLTEVALRVERSGSGREAGLQGVLASGLELGRGETTSGERSLARHVVEAATQGMERVRLADVLSVRGAMRGVLAGLAGAALVVSISWAEPGLARTGAMRMLWPFGHAEWPKRTMVADVTGVTHHPLGTALALRGALVKSSQGSRPERVSAEYRLVVDGRAGAWRTVVLTDQEKTVAAGAIEIGSENAGEVRTGRLFERLLEPGALMPAGVATAGATSRTASVTAQRGPLPKVRLEYALLTEDDRTAERVIELVEPPAVVGASLEVRGPAYVAGEGGSKTVDLGAGSDERAAPSPVLAGSRVRLRIELNKPVPVPSDAGALAAALGPELAAVLSEQQVRVQQDVLASGGGASGGGASGGMNTWTAEFVHERSVRLAVKPVDEFGIAAGEEAIFRLDVLSDNPPAATVTLPAEDKSVLATASVDVEAEGRDDVGLAGLVLERRLARRTPGSASAAAEAQGEWTRAGEPAQLATGAVTKSATVSTRLELSSLSLTAGDEVWVSAVATDAFELGGKRHEPVRSAARRLRILSKEQFVEQVFAELAVVRRGVIQIDKDQKDLAAQSAMSGQEQAQRAERTQAQLTERISRQTENVKRQMARIAENALGDQSLEQVVREAQERLDQAGRRSSRASEKLAESARAQSKEGATPESGAPEREEAQEEQRQVRDELSRVIEMLDQGEDAFASKRSLERLLGQQKALRQKTEQAGRTTTGKSQEQLDASEKQALDQIAQDQQGLAEQLKDAVKKLREREKKLSAQDPASAQALGQAAQRSQREQVAEKMQEAARQTKQNRTNTAQQQQQQAEASLEQMIQELENAPKNRDEVLRRQLATLIESLENLVTTQTTELGRLVEARKGETVADAGLDAQMAQLHQNTLGVLEEIAAGGRELTAIGDLVTPASEAQAQAVVDLRAKPVRDEAAEAQERQALKKLTEALEQAKALDQQANQRQQDRERGELRKKYQEALQKQVELRDAAQALAEGEQGRRTRAAARQLGEDQEALRTQVAEIAAKTSELKDAKVFEFAHQRLDRLMQQAQGKLAEGESSASVTRDQTSAARVLKSLADALGEGKKDDKEFREAQGQGSGGGQSGGKKPLIPNSAEIRVLRDLQQEAAERTRELAEASAPDADAVEAVGRLQRELATQAQQLIERLKDEAGGGGAGGPEAAPANEPKKNRTDDKKGTPKVLMPGRTR